MKKSVIIKLVVIYIFIVAPCVYALGSSYGNIDKTYDYANFEIRSGANGGNLISGSIINKTNTVHDGVYITIFGLDYFDKILWKKIIFINVIDKYGKYPFIESIGDGKEPSKLSFKVTE